MEIMRTVLLWSGTILLGIMAFFLLLGLGWLLTYMLTSAYYQARSAWKTN